MIRAGGAPAFFTSISYAWSALKQLPHYLFSDGIWMSLLGLAVAVLVITTVTRFLQRR